MSLFILLIVASLYLIQATCHSDSIKIDSSKVLEIEENLNETFVLKIEFILFLMYFSL